MRSIAKRNPYYKTIVCPLMRHSKWIKCMRCDDSIDDDDDDSTDTKRLAGWICRSIENMYRSKERQKGGWFSSVRNHYCRKSMRKVSLSLARAKRHIENKPRRRTQCRHIACRQENHTELHINGVLTLMNIAQKGFGSVLYSVHTISAWIRQIQRYVTCKWERERESVIARVFSICSLRIVVADFLSNSFIHTSSDGVCRICRINGPCAHQPIV